MLKQQVKKRSKKSISLVSLNRSQEGEVKLLRIIREYEKIKAEFQSLLDHCPIPIVIYASDGKAKYINPSFLKTFGWTSKELIGKKILFVPEDQVQRTKEAIQRVLDGESITDFITKRLTQDGRLLDLNLTSFRYMDAKGNPSGIIVYLKDITEETNSRRRIKEEREKIFRILEEMRDGVCLVGPDYKIRYLNQMMKRDLGEGIGSFCYEYYHGQDSVCESCDLKKLMDKKLLRYERTYRNHRTYDVITTEFLDTDGATCRIIFLRDITDRKQMEEALRKSEAQFRIIVESAHDGISYIDKKGTILFANPKLKEIFKDQNLEGKSLIEFYDEENQKILAKHLERRWQGIPTTYEIQIRDKGSQRHDMQVTGYPFRDEKGNIHGAVGIYRDITERKEVEEQIRREKETFSILLQKAPYGVVLIDQKGKYLYVNPEFTNITGYTLSDVPTGKEWFKKAYPDPGYRKQLIDLWRKDLPLKGINRITHITSKDGSIKEVEMQSILWEDGRALVVLNDLTEKNRLEQQLRQAQKIEAIGTLAGGLAHDFNNILTAITGYTSLMKIQMDKNHPFFDAVDMIEQSAHRAAGLTQQLLGFARKGVVKVESVDLNRMVGHVLSLIQETFDRAISIETHLQTGLNAIAGDSGQLEQVLLNLCLNARDAMPEGGKLTIDTSGVELNGDSSQIFSGLEAGEYVLLQVSDTGMGIPPEIQHKIFDPFFTTKENGTGMGLAMVYTIVKNHGGYVNVLSETGRGSCFNLYFPKSKKVSDKKEEEIREELPRGKETILIVDDEKLIREMGSKILQNLGYRVFLAKDGREASELYREKKQEIDLVILDMIMPVMGGDETYQRLKEINPAVKVIVSSGYSIQDQAKEMIRDGVRDFIQKPFGVKELTLMVRKVLDA